MHSAVSISAPRRIAVSRVASMFVLFAVPFAANAIPIQLSSAQFTTSIGGASSVLTEDFEGLAGALANPLIFANGRVTTDGFFANAVVFDSLTFCGTTNDNCLFTQAIADTRTIDALPVGTTLWGTDLFFIRPDDIMVVTVTGGSGILSFQATGSSFSGFAGFSDMLGIYSVSFRNLGHITPTGTASGNYSFDNIRTGTLVTVPEPTTLSLLCGGFLALGLGRRRGKSFARSLCQSAPR